MQLGARQTATLLCVRPVLIASAHELLPGGGGGASTAPSNLLSSGLSSALSWPFWASRLGGPPRLWLPTRVCLAASSSHQGPLSCEERHAWLLPMWSCLQVQACGSWPRHGVVVHVGTVARAGLPVASGPSLSMAAELALESRAWEAQVPETVKGSVWALSVDPGCSREDTVR